MNEQKARPADRPDARNKQLDPVPVELHGLHLTTQRGVRLGLDTKAIPA